MSNQVKEMLLSSQKKKQKGYEVTTNNEACPFIVTMAKAKLQ